MVPELSLVPAKVHCIPGVNDAGATGVPCNVAPAPAIVPLSLNVQTTPFNSFTWAGAVLVRAVTVVRVTA